MRGFRVGGRGAAAARACKLGRILQLRYAEHYASGVKNAHGDSSWTESHPCGTWCEAIALFAEVHEGRRREAAHLASTAGNPEALLADLLRLLGVFLRGEPHGKIERFLAAAHRAGPPPRHAPPLPMPRPLDTPNEEPPK